MTHNGENYSVKLQNYFFATEPGQRTERTVTRSATEYSVRRVGAAPSGVLSHKSADTEEASTERWARTRSSV